MVPKLLMQIHDVLVSGCLRIGGSWGGEECFGHSPLSTHYIELIVYPIIILLILKQLQIPIVIKHITSVCNQYFSGNKRNYFDNVLSLTLAFIHFSMYFMLIYYKYNKDTMIFLIQPCHFILLIQGVALASRGPLGVCITLFVLPALIGCTLAIFFPDTSGLDQILEEQSYWYQHYLILIVPLYLLCRDSFLVSRIACIKTVLVGLALLAISHFPIYHAIDVFLQVNVEFMLCPTPAMSAIFQHIPPTLLWPSYRLFMTVVVTVVGGTLAFMYIGVSRFFDYLITGRVSNAKGKLH